MRRFTLALLVALLAPLPALAQSLIVLESSLPNYALGAEVSADAALNLPDKSRLVLVAEDGRSVVLTGPFQGNAKSKMAAGGGGNKAFSTALASLVRSAQEETSSVGAVRAAGIGTRDEALMVNLSESGDYCVAEPAKLMITRYKHETAPKISITVVADSSEVQIAWPSGTDRTAWPIPAKVEDGARFIVSQDGKDSRTLITLVKVSGNYPTVAHEAVEMANAGCAEQARMLLALMRRQAK